jgi:hypothetical protein
MNTNHTVFGCEFCATPAGRDGCPVHRRNPPQCTSGTQLSDSDREIVRLTREVAELSGRLKAIEQVVMSISSMGGMR